MAKRGPIAENLKGLNNGRFTVLRRVEHTGKDTYWLLSCNECGAEKTAGRTRVKGNGVRCQCQKPKKQQRYKSTIPRIKNIKEEALALLPQIQAQVTQDSWLIALTLATRLLYRLRKVNKRNAAATDSDRD